MDQEQKQLLLTEEGRERRTQKQERERENSKNAAERVVLG